jgi:hypothetical protein
MQAREVYMKTLSLRSIDAEMADALKKRAKYEGRSINATVLNLLREAVGLTKKKRTRVYHDLDDLVGTWTEKDEQLFKKATKYFDRIDEEIWG